MTMVPVMTRMIRPTQLNTHCLDKETRRNAFEKEKADKEEPEESERPCRTTVMTMMSVHRNVNGKVKT
jgi:hypothetical protein